MEATPQHPAGQSPAALHYSPPGLHRANPPALHSLQELALLEYDTLQFAPSALAAAALMLAQLAQRQAPSSELLGFLCGHSMDLLRDAADLLMRLHFSAWTAKEGSPSQPMAAVRSKYATPVYCQASRLPPAVAYAQLASKGA